MSYILKFERAIHQRKYRHSIDTQRTVRAMSDLYMFATRRRIKQDKNNNTRWYIVCYSRNDLFYLGHLIRATPKGHPWPITGMISLGV